MGKKATKKEPSERWPGMTRKQHHKIGLRMRDLADVLGLRDWLIKFSYTPVEDKDALAEIKCTYGQKIARISVCMEFAERTREEQDKVIIHELLHCHLDAIHTVVHDGAVESVMGLAAFTLLSASLHDAIEWAVDAIAVEIATILGVRK